MAERGLDIPGPLETWLLISVDGIDGLEIQGTPVDIQCMYINITHETQYQTWDHSTHLNLCSPDLSSHFMNLLMTFSSSAA